MKFSFRSLIIESDINELVRACSNSNPLFVTKSVNLIFTTFKVSSNLNYIGKLFYPTNYI